MRTKIKKKSNSYNDRLLSKNEKLFLNKFLNVKNNETIVLYIHK